MTYNLKSIVFVALAPVLLSACNSSGGDTSSPAMVVATQGGLGTPGNLFPDTITGGDGFQADPVNDASFATLINTVRTSAGTTPVTFNAKLDSAAQKHSQAMVAGGFFAHTNPITNSTVASRVQAEGYQFSFVAENIAQGQANENQAMNGWINSPGHQANNVNPSAKEFGLGRAGSGANTTWTLVLAAPL